MSSNGNQSIDTLDEVFKDYFEEKHSSNRLGIFLVEIIQTKCCRWICMKSKLLVPCVLETGIGHVTPFLDAIAKEETFLKKTMPAG